MRLWGRGHWRTMSATPFSIVLCPIGHPVNQSRTRSSVILPQASPLRHGSCLWSRRLGEKCHPQPCRHETQPSVCTADPEQVIASWGTRSPDDHSHSRLFPPVSAAQARLNSHHGHCLNHLSSYLPVTSGGLVHSGAVCLYVDSW